MLLTPWPRDKDAIGSPAHACEMVPDGPSVMESVRLPFLNFKSGELKVLTKGVYRGERTPPGIRQAPRLQTGFIFVSVPSKRRGLLLLAQLESDLHVWPG